MSTLTDTVEGAGVEQMMKSMPRLPQAASGKLVEHRDDDDSVRGSDMDDDARGTARPTVTVVIPTRNEARNLPYVAKRMPAVNQIVVVNGNSMDNTVEVARQL